MTANLGTLWKAFEYDKVDAKAACALLGVAIPPGVEPQVALLAAVPPVAGRDDPFLEALHRGLGINRKQFQRSYADWLQRLQR